MSGPALAHSINQSHAHLHAMKGGGQVALIRAPRDVRRVEVRWGDGARAVISRHCGSTTDFVAAHQYPRGARHTLTWRVAADCGSRIPSRISASANDQTTGVPSGGNWTDLTGTDTLTGTTTYTTYDGTPTPDGTSCEFPATSTNEGVNATNVEEQEVAINVSDCEMVMETGTPPTSVVTAAFGTNGTDGPPAASGSDLNQSLDATTQATNQVEYAAQWRDYVHGVMNEVAETLNWTHGKNCVTSTNEWAVGYPTPGIGWALDYNNQGMTPSCTGSTINANAGFSDNNFCNGNATYNTYTSVYLTGLYNGKTQTGRSGFADGSSCAKSEGLHTIFHRDF
jgi:hypothetical protein